MKFNKITKIRVFFCLVYCNDLSKFEGTLRVQLNITLIKNIILLQSIGTLHCALYYLSVFYLQHISIGPNISFFVYHLENVWFHNVPSRICSKYLFRDSLCSGIISMLSVEKSCSVIENKLSLT